MAVNFVTFDGAVSKSPTSYEISEAMDPDPTLTIGQRNLGGGTPANVAIRLIAAQGSAPAGLWKWWPIDYKPGFRMQNILAPNLPYDLPMSSGSIGRALAMLAEAVPQMSGPIVLCGLSNGAWIVDLAYRHFSNPNGMFYDRLNDLKAVITFGSPLRPFGHTIPLTGAISPVGQGIADFPHALSFGTVPGLVANPPALMWSFCQLDDGASDSDRAGLMKTAQNAIAEFLYDGDLDSGIPVIFQILPLLAGLGATGLWSLLNPSAASKYSIGKWWPFIAGATSNQNLPPGPNNPDPRIANPHAQYNSLAYDALITSPAVSSQLQGDWNPVTNTPVVSNSTGANGHSWRVSAAGSRNLGSGTLSFAAGDIIVKTGGVWVKAVKNTKTAVDLAVEFLLKLAEQYAEAPVIVPATLGYTWWQNPPNPS